MHCTSLHSYHHYNYSNRMTWQNDNAFMYKYDLDHSYETSWFNNHMFERQTVTFFALLQLFELHDMLLYLFSLYECNLDHKYEAPQSNGGYMFGWTIRSFAQLKLFRSKVVYPFEYGCDFDHRYEIYHDLK